MSKTLATVLLFFSLLGLLYGEGNPEHALALINHVNWVVSKVITTKSKVALEAEYDGISADGLFLDCIDDQETIDAIKAVMQTITDARLNEMEREFLQEVFEEDKRYLIYSAIPNPTAIISPDLRSVAINLASSVITGYMHYKQAEQMLQRQFKKDSFELDKAQITYLHDLNTELLQKHYELVRKYRLDDKRRLTVKLLEELNIRVNDSNSGYQTRTYEYLLLNEDVFQYLPEYWYFRGVYAGMNNKLEDEMAAYDHFQRIHFPFLRNDKIAASVAMNKCKLLIRQNGKRTQKEIERQLNIILANTGAKDWEFQYFCGLTYLHQLSSPEKACTCLQKAVNHLDFSFLSTIYKYYDKIDKGEKVERNLNGNWLRWDSSVLLISRTQLLQAMVQCKSNKEIGEYFCSLMENQTVSAFEFFPYFIDEKLFSCGFLNYFYTTSFCHVEVCWTQTDKLQFYLPIRLFYLGFYIPNMKLLSDGKVIRELECKKIDNLFLWNNGLSYDEIHFKKKKGVFRCVRLETLFELDRMEDLAIDCIDVEFPAPQHKVTLRFKSDKPKRVPKDISKDWLHPTHIICDGKVIELNEENPKLGIEEAALLVRKFFNKR